MVYGGCSFEASSRSDNAENKKNEKSGKAHFLDCLKLISCPLKSFAVLGSPMTGPEDRRRSAHCDRQWISCKGPVPRTVRNSFKSVWVKKKAIVIGTAVFGFFSLLLVPFFDSKPNIICNLFLPNCCLAQGKISSKCFIGFVAFLPSWTALSYILVDFLVLKFWTTFQSGASCCLHQNAD